MTAHPADRLSPREREVLRLWVGGASEKQIAETLSIAPFTVKCHKRNTVDKLHVSGLGGVLAAAFEAGYLRWHDCPWLE